MVLELGAGVGTLGLLTAALGIPTLVTEIEDSVPALERSIKANAFKSEDRIASMPLNWFEKSDADKVIAILKKRNLSSARQGGHGSQWPHSLVLCPTVCLLNIPKGDI